MEASVTVENLSKRYRIASLHAGYRTLRESLIDGLTLRIRRLRGGIERGQTLWALKDISFVLHPGEVLGLIGHNGAGKSTLLKTLSRITKPTTGRIVIKGRIGSLLEVGTGFHPDLTGRENIYLNGAILGMRSREIARKFDEIVAFSELEQFIETPVKWYSSGMYLRLAFSVAAHLEPEILMMDEVLAVGDAGFQLKCLNKMSEIRQEGRTILFVSHNMPAIIRLCRRVILLDQGRILGDGLAQTIVSDYLGKYRNLGGERRWNDPDGAPGNSVVRLRKVRVQTQDGSTNAMVGIDEEVAIELTYDVLMPGHVVAPNVDLFNEEGLHLFASQDVDPEWRYRPKPKGQYVSIVRIPGNFLAEGRFTIDVGIVSGATSSTELYVCERNVVSFQVHDRGGQNTARGDRVGPIPGVVRPLLDWSTEFNPGTVEEAP